MDVVVIENEAMRVGVMPHYGARVVSLVDKASGREWMVQGQPSNNIGEGAVYAAAEAVGWDECFPTVAPWDATGTVWNRRLRDHGDLWGRPWAVGAQSASAVTMVYSDATYRFARTLSLDACVLTAAYEVDNFSDRDMPYLWALHGLLAVTPSDRIIIEGIDTVAATYLNFDRPLPAQQISWPDTGGTLPFPLDRVQSAGRGFAGKFYSRAPSRRASVGREGAFLTLAWDAGLALGIWLNYGGWPSTGGPHHLALEPTSGTADHLGEAIAGGEVVPIPAGGRGRWSVTLTTGGELEP